tara:strand:+ start:10655 stop:10855 length:201 start_codon:yes stop_codon:yes gene_type:complete
MKYECIKDGMGKDGRHITAGRVIELDEEYAEHLVTKGLIVAVGSSSKKKQRAVTKPQDLEQAVEEE